MGGISSDWGIDVAVDSNGNVYTTGYYRGVSDFDPGPTVYSLSTPYFSESSFLSKLDGNGNFVSVLKFGGIDTTFVEASSCIVLKI